MECIIVRGKQRAVESLCACCVQQVPNLWLAVNELLQHRQRGRSCNYGCVMGCMVLMYKVFYLFECAHMNL